MLLLYIAFASLSHRVLIIGLIIYGIGSERVERRSTRQRVGGTFFFSRAHDYSHH